MIGRWTVLWIFLLSLPIPAAVDQESGETIQEELEVARILLDVRVIDTKGNPILGLKADDFLLKRKGKKVPLLTCEWVPAAKGNLWNLDPGAVRLDVSEEELDPESDAFWQDPEVVTELPTGGRLVVLFFQGDIAGDRNYGRMRMASHSRQLVEGLTAEDYVAVVSFFSHLKIHMDFTRDHEAALAAIEDALLNREVPNPDPDAYPSFFRFLDKWDAYNTATPEKALTHLALALEPYEGSKTLVFLGWGLGQDEVNFPKQSGEYKSMARALTRARVTVFSLDVTMADFHTLESGLRELAEDTGGFYEKTHEFANQAVLKVVNTIGGYYRISFERPDKKRPTRRYSLNLVSRKGRVLVGDPQFW